MGLGHVPGRGRTPTKIYRHAFYAYNKIKKLDRNNIKNIFRSFRVEFVTS
jgi:hypothetical protein